MTLLRSRESGRRAWRRRWYGRDVEDLVDQPLNQLFSFAVCERANAWGGGSAVVGQGNVGRIRTEGAEEKQQVDEAPEKGFDVASVPPYEFAEFQFQPEPERHASKRNRSAAL